MWLLLIDAYSKWPEVHAMSSTTAQATAHAAAEKDLCHTWVTTDDRL